jgi:ATP-dependent Clp protease adaptor protein ClpS
MSNENGGRNDDDGGGRFDEAVITKEKVKAQRPSLYKVILLNDDFTPMDFVILVLKKFFLKTDAEAERIMLQVHREGAGLAGIYTFEMAETKVYAVNELSRRHKHPLKCIMEKE